MNIRQRLASLAKSSTSLTLVMAIAAGGVLMNALAALAQVPPFPQCPPVGYDTGCAVLIVFNPDGSRTTLVDPTQPSFDGVEDTLIGVQNNSGQPVTSLALTGPFIFGFDFDGLCSGTNSNPFTPPVPPGSYPVFSPPPRGCDYDSTGYAGRFSTTSTADTSPGGGNTFTVTDTTTFSSGTVNWSPGIPTGGSAYFSLEGPTASVAPPLPPSSCTLSPATATNPVDTSHTVTATVTNATGFRVPGQTVLFTVTGAVNTTGSCTTDTTGTCSFTYTGPALPGADAITACDDTDGDRRCGGTTDLTCSPATKVWTLPLSTAFCTVDLTYGGWITAQNSDRANFGGNASADEAGSPSGQEEYQDKGPANPMNVHSINVLAVTCTTTPPPATGSIFGEATIDGSGSHVYRIDVQDGGKGVGKYEIRLDTGYDSGNETLQGGQVTIHK